MRSLLLIALALLTTAARAQTSPHCDFGGQVNLDHTVKLLQAAPSCKQANTILHACMWGSSADTTFAPIAIDKCEQVFLKKLTPPAEQRYVEEMQLCSYAQSGQDGTLFMSEAALCQADVAEKFADHPDNWQSSPLRASFDCALAKSPLEQAICSNVTLGHADIILSRNYTSFLKSARPAQRPALVANERAWLNSLPAKCSLGSSAPSQKTVNCLRNEFEARFTLLDGCPGPIDDCVASVLHPDPEDAAPSPPSYAPRASFDCEKPSSPLELTVCADSNLGEADNQLAAILSDARQIVAPPEKSALDNSQKNWLKFVNTACPWGSVGAVPSLDARSCVALLYEKRTAQVQRCARGPVTDQTACFSQFEGFSTAK